MEHLRSRLKNTLQLTGMTPFTFAFNCGLMNSNTITGFLEGKVKPHKASIQKIEDELMRMGANQLMEAPQQRITYGMLEENQKLADSMLTKDQEKAEERSLESILEEVRTVSRHEEYKRLKAEEAEESNDDLFLTEKERAVLVTQIMNTNYNLMTLDEKTALIGKLDLL